MVNADEHRLVDLARREHEPALRRLLLARFGNPEDADERLQDFYAHLLTLPFPEEEIESWEAYFVGILVNRVADWMRDPVNWEMLTLKARAEAGEAATAWTHVEDQVTAIQQMQLLADVLNSLPPITSAIFGLRKLEGASRAEIASRFRMKVEKVDDHIETVKRRYKRALNPPPPRQAKRESP